MNGEKNKLGNELLYIENSIKYNGIQLFEDFNLYVKKDDIIITTNETTRESIVFKKITK